MAEAPKIIQRIYQIRIYSNTAQQARFARSRLAVSVHDAPAAPLQGGVRGTRRNRHGSLGADDAVLLELRRADRAARRFGPALAVQCLRRRARSRHLRQTLPPAFVVENVTGIDQMGAREQIAADLSIDGEYMVLPTVALPNEHPNAVLNIP